MAITYTTSTDGVTPAQLHGFFEGWPNPPSPDRHLKLPLNSDHIVLAVDDEKRIVGYITAVTDHVLAAYIPHLEVLRAHRGQGIGRELMRRMLDQLRPYYMVDLICDADVQPFYEKLGMQRYTGMIVRNYAQQLGRDDE